VFYPNNVAKGVLKAGMRFIRLKMVILRSKQRGFFLARLLAGALCFREFSHLEFPGVPRFSPLDLGHDLLAAALLGRAVLADVALLFRGFLTNLLKSPNLSSYQCLFFIRLFLSSFSESLGIVLLRFFTSGHSSR